MRRLTALATITTLAWIAVLTAQDASRRAARVIPFEQGEAA